MESTGRLWSQLIQVEKRIRDADCWEHGSVASLTDSMIATVKEQGKLLGVDPSTMIVEETPLLGDDTVRTWQVSGIIPT